jgi:hypothetical protein
MDRFSELYVVLFLEIQIQVVACLIGTVYELHVYLMACWVALTVQNLNCFHIECIAFGV